MNGAPVYNRPSVNIPLHQSLRHLGRIGLDRCWSGFCVLLIGWRLSGDKLPKAEPSPDNGASDNS